MNGFRLSVHCMHLYQQDGEKKLTSHCKIVSKLFTCYIVVTCFYIVVELALSFFPLSVVAGWRGPGAFLCAPRTCESCPHPASAPYQWVSTCLPLPSFWCTQTFCFYVVLRVHIGLSLNVMHIVSDVVPRDSSPQDAVVVEISRTAQLFSACHATWTSSLPTSVNIYPPNLQSGRKKLCC